MRQRFRLMADEDVRQPQKHSAGEMQAAGRVGAGGGVECFHRLRRRQIDEFDPFALQEIPRGLRDAQQAMRAATHDESVRPGFNNLAQIGGAERMSLFAPPGRNYPIGQDDYIIAVGLPVDDDLAEFVTFDIWHLCFAVGKYCPYWIPAGCGKDDWGHRQ